MNQILTVVELSAYLNCSQSLIRKQIREKQIKYFRVGKKILFDKLVIDKWIQSQFNLKEREE